LTARLLGSNARDLRGQTAHPENDLLEPAALATAAPLLADAPILVNRAEDPSSQRVNVSLAAVLAASAIGF
jgi:hypothetical protein